MAVWRFRLNAWVALGAGVLAPLGMLANAPFLAGNLSHPESWGSFIPSALALVGALLAFVAGVTPRFSPEASFRGRSVSAPAQLPSLSSGSRSR